MTFYKRLILENIVVQMLISNNRKLYLYSHSMGGAIGALFLEKYNNYDDDYDSLNKKIMQLFLCIEIYF